MLKHNIDVIGMLSDKKPRKEEDIKKSHQRLFLCNKALFLHYNVNYYIKL
ncbi:hypothetical protein [Neoehrlichia mikurensis]|uniref:Uncharacterized protein n=2 Tax=Neoehrlichia mikurensis TaxID=89586 RepID=A0ABY5EX23_9RICK|nr:hypothetical protein [Neoehrlichia mikurensis]UTO56327.1 hypothetical protein LUA81_04465 [Neoehrlichia mikurensis]